MALTKVKASNITLSTPAASSNDTTPATTAYVTTALANLVDSAPSTLNTLNELAAALGDDANFSTTVTNSIAAKAPLASPTFTSNINGGDGVELRLGDSQDILFKHHSSGYGHLQNTTGAFYIDSETFEIRSDVDDLAVAIGIDANQRVGINQTPASNNFTLQVTGQQTDGTDARVAYFKGYGTHTSIGSTGPTVVIQNANGTTNNYAKLSFESSNAGETVSINAQNIDHSNHYGDMAFNTRGSGGYSEKMRITSNGNVGIGETNPGSRLTVGDEAHGVGIDYVGSTLPSIAGIFTSSSGLTATAYGDLNIKARTDYGGNYSIGFFTASSNNTLALRMSINASGHLTPAGNNLYDLGSTANRWRNIYTNDLNLSNEGNGGNDIDGSEGNWTIQEGETDLFIINNKNGKRYKFALEELE